MTYSKRVRTEMRTVVDQDTGEVISEDEIGTDVLVKTQEDFFFTFSKHMGAILGLDGNEIKVLLWSAMNCQLGTNEIVLNKAIKVRMGRATGLKVSSIDNALSKLVKKQMMYRIATGLYCINPEATWRGKMTGRTKQVKVYLNYQIGPQNEGDS